MCEHAQMTKTSLINKNCHQISHITYVLNVCLNFSQLANMQFLLDLESWHLYKFIDNHTHTHTTFKNKICFPTFDEQVISEVADHKSLLQPAARHKVTFFGLKSKVG